MVKLSGVAVLLLVVVPLGMYTCALLVGIQLGRALERGAAGDYSDNVEFTWRGALDYVTKELWDINVLGRRRGGRRGGVIELVPLVVASRSSGGDERSSSSKQLYSVPFSHLPPANDVLRTESSANYATLSNQKRMMSRIPGEREPTSTTPRQRHRVALQEDNHDGAGQFSAAALEPATLVAEDPVVEQLDWGSIEDEDGAYGQIVAAMIHDADPKSQAPQSDSDRKGKAIEDGALVSAPGLGSAFTSPDSRVGRGSAAPESIDAGAQLGGSNASDPGASGSAGAWDGSAVAADGDKTERDAITAAAVSPDAGRMRTYYDTSKTKSSANNATSSNQRYSNHTSPRGVISVGPWGGSGGQPFYMRGLSAPRLRRITLYHSGAIHSLSCEYTLAGDIEGPPPRVAGPWGLSHSYGSRGVRTKIELPSGEHITAVEGTTGHFANVPGVVITSLTFRTSAGRTYGPYGSVAAGSHYFSVPAADGACIVGLWGRSGWLVDAIGVYMKPSCSSSSSSVTAAYKMKYGSRHQGRN